MGKLIIFIILVSSAFAGYVINTNTPEPTYMIACAKSNDQVDRCMRADSVFYCTDYRRKKIVNNDIYENCVEHKL